MIRLSMLQALSIWSDLCDALYGRASHGDEAEIYAYRLMDRDPSAEHARVSNAAAMSWRVALREQECFAACSLTEIVQHFERERDAVALIDGMRPGEWRAACLQAGGFSHRAKVRVERRPR